jgi:hypothetical protein
MPGQGRGISPLLRRSGGGAAVATYITATGGNVTRDGDYLVHTFLGSDTLNITQTSNNPTYNTFQCLIVAGGGCGGSASGSAGGGGGAGGLILTSSTSSISVYPVVVGAGGGFNSNGGNSTFNGLTAIGGGYGATLSGGAYGGSGGGESNYFQGIGFGVVGQGFNGGPAGLRSGGGGGAGQNGQSSNNSALGGNGGNGFLSNINGTSLYYSGGGGGGGYTNGGNGGNGGGGLGGTFITFPYPPGLPGTSNTGGGGGASAGPGNINGGNGGSGIVIVRYYSPITFGSRTLAYSNTIYSRGGSLTANEVTYLNTFEASVGSDLDEFDRLYIHGLSNEIAAKTSFVNPTSTMITAVNSPTFTPSVGYNSNGSTSYLNLNFNLRNDAVKFKLNDCSQFTYSRTNSASTQVDSGGSDGSNKTLMDIREIDDRSYSFINVSVSDGLSNYVAANSLGLFFSKRVASNLAYQYQAGVLKNTITVASTALPNISLFALALNNNGSPLYHANRQTSIRGYGSGAINQTTFYNAVQALGTSIGWAV